MNSKNNAISTPFTIQNYNNYLRDYIHISGFKWDSKCLEVIFKNIQDNFEKYIQKIGDYNTVSVISSKFFKQKTFHEKNYNLPCPEGWTYKPEKKGCVNPFYSAEPFGGKCIAGRSKLVKQEFSNCPNGPYSDGYYYSEWTGPFDASKINLSNTNIGNKKVGEGSYCNAGYKNKDSLEAAKYDCTNSDGTWVTYNNDPNFTNNSYTCYKPAESQWVTENAPNFSKFTEKQKKDWETKCKAYWPMKTINVPDQWICQYGAKLSTDISKGNIFKIGTANSPVEAAKIALRSNRMKDNYFIMIEKDIYIVGRNGNIGVVTSKGFYNKNCEEQNNKKAELYLINQEFFNILEQCKLVNDKINNINTNRIILRDSVNYFNENFENRNETEEIIKNQNQIINNLANNFNKKVELYNKNIDLINTNEIIIEKDYNKLNQQLDDLQKIQNQITLKDRIIEFNDELNEKQIHKKEILIQFLILLPFLCLPLLFIIFKILRPVPGFSIIGIIVISFIIYLFINLNKNKVKNFGLENKRVVTKYEKAIANYLNKEKCSQISEQNEEEGISNKIIKSNGPIYYYDGSAPPYQIYPDKLENTEK